MSRSVSSEELAEDGDADDGGDEGDDVGTEAGDSETIWSFCLDILWSEDS